MLFGQIEGVKYLTPVTGSIFFLFSSLISAKFCFFLSINILLRVKKSILEISFLLFSFLLILGLKKSLFGLKFNNKNKIFFFIYEFSSFFFLSIIESK